MVCPLCKSISNVLVPHTPPQLVNSTFEQTEEDSGLVAVWNTPDSELEGYIQRSLNAPRPQAHGTTAFHAIFRDSFAYSRTSPQCSRQTTTPSHACVSSSWPACETPPR